MKSLSKIFLVSLLAALGLSSCSSLYYFPSRKVLVLRDRMPIQPQDVYFESEDGTKLHGWYFSPLRGEEPKAVIVQFHGNGENLTTHFFSLYEAPSRGFAYLSFDYRGYGQSQGSPDPAGVIKDGVAAIRWMHNRHPDKPLVVFAQSLGGAVAFRSVTRVKNEIPISLMLVDSTFPDYRSQARAFFGSSVFTFLFQPLAWLAADNSQTPREDIPQISPIPLIVVHGTKDRVVPISMGRKVFELAREPKEFWEIPGAKHTQFMFMNEGEEGERFYVRVAEIAKAHTARDGK
jgi:fermentation-respiration switch protein FrsA (DUF1100 family)